MAKIKGSGTDSYYLKLECRAPSNSNEALTTGIYEGDDKTES